MMGQFAEDKECKECNCAPCECDTTEDDVQEAYIKTSKDASDTLGVLRGKGKKIERGQDDDQGNLANQYASDVWDVYSWIEARTNGFKGIDPKFQSAIDDMMTLRGEAKKLETKPGSGKNGRFGNQIVNTLYPVMQYIDAHDFNQDEDDTEEGMDPNEQKTPLGEFILSYFDRQEGAFPKGETAVLTMVEKEYGDQYVKPAQQFIGRLHKVVSEYSVEEDSKRWKQTSMDPKLAILKFGADNVKIKKGGLNNGKDMVSVLTDDAEQDTSIVMEPTVAQDEDLSNIRRLAGL
jgi:hypothetical protein